MENKKNSNNTCVIILAAGLGKRMQSGIPKVLHVIAGEPLIIKSLKVVNSLQPDQIVVVIGHKGQMVKQALRGHAVDFAFQEKQLGTADAVSSALSKINDSIENVIVLNGDDSAFYNPQTIKKLINLHLKNANTLTFLSATLNNPSGLGRVVRSDGKPVEIIEEKDASEMQKRIKEINCGLYLINKNWLTTNIGKVSKSKISGEYYLVDLIRIATNQKERVDALLLENPDEWLGVNTPQDLERADLKAQALDEKLHFMGIAGAGQSAVAALAAKSGYQISGCDSNPDSPYTKKLSIKILKGHNVNHLKNITRLIISPAVSKLNSQNPELLFAKRQKIPISTWQEFQGKYLQKNKFVITVAGGYGKSTTTAMVSKILEDSDFDPSCVIGAKLIDWDTNFRFGNSRYYVCEADEYNNNFLNYQPDIAVILNTAWDHPDFFKSKSQLINSYSKYIANIKKNGTLVLGDDHTLFTKVLSTRSDIKVIKIKDFGKLNLSIIGDFRAENANAALTVAQILSLDSQKAKQSVEKFKGLGRRLEFKGMIGSCKVYDDYAVQPYTVVKTANALKDKFPKSRIALVFEPHTFSRIETFFDDFIDSLNKVNVDEILITDVFAARETGNASKLSVRLQNSVKPKATYTGSIEKTARYLKKNLSKYDIVLSMGAGDVFKIFDLIKSK